MRAALEVCGATEAPSAQNASQSLLLATSAGILLPLAGNNFAKHDDTITIHESDSRKTLTVFESVTDERLLRLEAALRHLVRLERMRILHFLSARLLAHLPLELGDTAGGTPAAHEADGGVANLDLIRDIKYLDLSVELASLSKGGIFLVDHHVARSRHVVLVQALDVQADIVSGVREIHTRVVHLDSEHLAGAWVGCGVCGQEHHLLAWLDDSLLHAARQHVAHTLDLVDSRDGHSHGCADGPLRHAAQLVEHIVSGVNVNGLLSILNVLALPPGHVIGLLQEIVAHPPGYRQDRRVF